MKLVFSALVGAFATAWAFQEWFSSFIILAVVCLLIFYWRWFYVAARTCRRDFTALYNYIRMLLLARRFSKCNSAISDIFHEVVLKHPDKKCFLMDDEVWTFRQVEDFSLRVSAALRAKGVKKDDVVGLMMSNSPELPATWLGITRLGAIVPLINTNQTGTALLHSINVAKCDVVIYGEEYEQAFRDIKGELDPSIKLLKYTHRPLNAVRNQVVEPSDFTAVLENTPLPFWFRSEGGGFSGKLLYIYTSGTTGLPKAAVITTAKVVTMASGMQYIGRIKPTDVVYCPMPLYHSAGGCIAIGQAFVFGCTVALRKKFSASSYFKDCIKYNATVAQYIGEMCRYVLSTPPSPMDKQHKVRLVFGNGMRPTVWSEFVERFNIQWVSEFYGATEGIGNTANADNKLGSIGFISRIIPSVYPIAVLKVNEETGEPIRTPDGLCQMAKPNEPGLFVGKINPNLASRAYLGYVDKEATNKKIIRNVFTLGDSAFISGDILVADELGYLYFRDRTGDTFRWRGENVSTTEVEAAISRVAEHRDAVVYGVEIPNTEGRAGMCGIVDTDDSLDLNKLLQDISKDLPKYARPIFMRKMNNVDLTGTYKMRKVDLQREGYDPNKVSDKLFYLDPKLDKYLPLGPEEYRIIVSGQIRL